MKLTDDRQKYAVTTDMAVLQQYVLVDRGLALDPPELCEKELADWLDQRGLHKNWMERLLAKEAELGLLANRLMRQNPRQTLKGLLKIGRGGAYQRKTAWHLDDRIDLARAAERGVGDRGHIRRFTNEGSIHGKHAKLSLDMLLALLAESGIPLNQRPAEVAPVIDFCAALIFVIPKLEVLMGRAFEREINTDADVRIELPDALMLNKLIGHVPSLETWIRMVDLYHDDMRRGLEDMEFRGMLTGIATSVYDVLQAEGLGRLDGVIAPTDIEAVLRRLCRLSRHGEAWLWAREVFYRYGPPSVVHEVMFLMPDPDDLLLVIEDDDGSDAA